MALFVYLPTPVDSAALLDSLQRVVALHFAQVPRAKVTLVSRLGAFSPSIALSMTARHEPRRAGLETEEAPAPVTEPSPAPLASDAQMGWQTIVSTTTPAPIDLSPRSPSARYKLVLEIQQELRRVGCYRGRMDGSWNYALKNAMKAFTNQVNATLPLDQPDYIQLALIQSQREVVCGACPVGQALAASGRCVGLPGTARTVAARQNEVLPWKAEALFKPVPRAVLSAAPLPGRMAIGGPFPTSVDALQGAPSVAPAAAATPLRTETAALEMTALEATVVEAPVTVTPKVVRRSSSSRRSARNHSRRFAGAAAPRRARSYRHGGSGTPRHNLLLSLGGVY
ncbi:MAG: hypothetical protein ABI457_12880 [Hyphomicrobium sp.]